MRKPIKVKLQRLFDGRFQVVQTTNAVNIRSTFLNRFVRFSVGTTLDEAEAEIVCADSHLDVTVNDIRGSA